MGMSLEDFSGVFQEARESNEKIEREQAELRAKVGNSMRNLKLGDPKWSLYATHLAEFADLAKGRYEAANKRLTGDTWLSDEETGQLRLTAAREGASYRAFKQAIDFIDTLIQRGTPEGEIDGNTI